MKKNKDRMQGLIDEAGKWGPDKAPNREFRDDPDAAPRAKESELISIRLPKKLLAILKAVAARQEIGYQVLIKRWLDEKVRELYTSSRIRYPIDGPVVFETNYTLKALTDEQVRKITINGST